MLSLTSNLVVAQCFHGTSDQAYCVTASAGKPRGSGACSFPRGTRMRAGQLVNLGAESGEWAASGLREQRGGARCEPQGGACVGACPDVRLIRLPTGVWELQQQPFGGEYLGANEGILRDHSRKRYLLCTEGKFRRVGPGGPSRFESSPEGSQLKCLPGWASTKPDHFGSGSCGALPAPFPPSLRTGPSHRA